MIVKDVIKAILPNSLHPHNLARARIIRRSRGKVIAGPFADQIYITCDEDFIEPSMLMGVYENELHPAIEEVLKKPPALFVNVGASQGYYAVGFARRAPQSRHVAFEIYEPRILQLNRTMAANSVAVELLGQCTPESLQGILKDSDDAFILVDVEGYEKELLDPVRVPGLRKTKMIVETHDHIVDGVTDELTRRFESSHRIKVVGLGRHTADDLPFLICDRWTIGQLNEGRPESQKWLIMDPQK